MHAFYPLYTFMGAGINEQFASSWLFVREYGQKCYQVRDNANIISGFHKIIQTQVFIGTTSHLSMIPSSSSLIPIGTLWPTLQPKIGQSNLSAFMALKSYRGIRFYTHLYCECLDSYWFSSWLGNFWPSGGQKHLKGGISRAPSQRKVFRTFLYMFWDISLKLGICIYIGGVTCQVPSFIPILTLWPTLQQKIDQSHLSAFMTLKVIQMYRGLRFGTHTQIVSALTPTDLRHARAIFGPLEGGVDGAPSQQKVLHTFFLHVSRYEFETWYIHPAGGMTHEVWVSSQSGLCTIIIWKAISSSIPITWVVCYSTI